jgi:hypothetical protein
MSDFTATVLAAILVAAGLLAQANLLRVFITDALEARRDVRRRALRAGATGAPMATGAPSTRVALCTSGLAMTIAWSALAESAEPPAPIAQPESGELTISTDRPSFSDTTGIAPAARLQLEMGYTFTFRNREGVETQRHNGPEALARVGLIDDRFELRLSTSGYVWSRTDDGSGAGFHTSDGWNDVSLGFKLKLIDQEGLVPRLALGAATTLGAGSRNISSRRAEPTVKLIWSYDLEKLGGESFKGFGVYGNINASWTNSNSERYWQGAASICGTYAISDRWSVFAEYYTLFPASKGTGPSHSVDFGTSYLLTPRIQLDARVGFGLSDKADSVFAGVGVSVLF